MFLIAFGSLVGIGIVEVGYHVYQELSPPRYDWKRQIKFLYGPDSIFRNLGDIFTYVPNSNIFVRDIYFSAFSYSTEYAYKIKTNNFGLVQDKDLLRGAKSILLLGDSFTEGQGAEPWFRQVAPQIERLNYQPINGGLRGTGFLHWWELEEFLSANKISISKLVIIFISTDLGRSKWNFSESALACLRSINFCGGNSLLVRLPPESELGQWIAKIRTTRDAHWWIKSALPATYRVYRFLLDIVKRPQQVAEVPPQSPRQIERVKTVINNMVEKYGRENVLFIHLPQKEEVEQGTVFPDGLLTRKFIQDIGTHYADGFALCGLTESDFFPVDRHPNQQGYSKIAKCTAQIIEQFLSQPKLNLSGQTAAFPK